MYLCRFLREYSCHRVLKNLISRQLKLSSIIPKLFEERLAVGFHSFGIGKPFFVNVVQIGTGHFQQPRFSNTLRVGHLRESIVKGN